MNYTKLLISLFMFITILTGCGDIKDKHINNLYGTSYTTTTKAVDPNASKNYGKIHLTATDEGSISFIDFDIILNKNSSVNLLDYKGTISLKGTIESTLPCINSKRVPLVCNNAKLFNGNINARCSVGNGNITLRIALFRGKKLKNSYSIAGILTDGCLNNNNNYDTF